MTSITNALGAGSGIDTRALVDSLANAAAAPAEAALDKREAGNKALLSTLSDAANAIDTLARAMTERVATSGLRPTLTANDATAMMFAGATSPLPKSMSLEVLARAQSQTSVLAPVSANARFDGGTIVLASGEGETRVTVGEGASLQDIADAIGQSASPVTARVVSDAAGQRLVLSGATGAARAFSLSYEGGDATLIDRVAGAQRVQTAQDARIRLDGVELASASDRFEEVVGGGTLTLTGAAAGARLTLTASKPDDAAMALLDDFVGAYNEVLAKITDASGDGASGGRAHPALRAMVSSLRTLTTAPLGAGEKGGPRTLAELGVRTQRDGTLALDRSQLTDALRRDPLAVAKLLLPAQASDDPSVRITNDAGRVAPGTYALTELALSADGRASGKIDGIDLQSIGDRLIAPASSAAVGLSLQLVTVPRSNVTLTISGGLAGALRTARDRLSGRDGTLTQARDALTSDARRIAQDRAVAERRAAAYRAQLETRFTSMDRMVGGFRATQAYLTQQIDAWSARER